MDQEGVRQRTTAVKESQAGGSIKPLPESKRHPNAPYTRTTYAEPIVVFYVFFAVNTFAALYAPIQDCDEVFNYWEPSHYLTHGSGLQTWEFSPDYAIRSWVYAGIHSGIIAIGRLLPWPGKVFEFYFLRVVLGFVCAVCETRLFSAVGKSLGESVAMLYAFVMIASPGMFHAAASYLPSSFAMYTTMLGMAAFMDPRGRNRTAWGIFWFAVGGVIGWPFAAALVIPFILEEFLVTAITRDVIPMVQRMLDGTVRSLIVLALQSIVDTFFYKKFVCVPLNIVLYNVFSSSSKGPNIYGTEPWHFYLRNLLLNFTVWFPLSLLSIPTILIAHIARRSSTTSPTANGQTLLRTITIASPLYLWLTIFTLQPHKEERFIYPAYPFLALNAALTLQPPLSLLSSSPLSLLPPKLRKALLLLSGLLTLDLALLRIAALATAYSAPLQVYTPLQTPNVARAGDTVCLGKEWYRFPSSYHLPAGVRAKFIRSAFRGLLPGEFSEAVEGFGFFPGAWLTPAGMNDENREDVGKYVDVEHCTFLVDSYFPSHGEGMELDPLEPPYVLQTGTWEKLKCIPFLDTAATGTLGRLIWIPEAAWVPDAFRRRWGKYCLLRRKGGVVKT
ncbi:glycosyltransferase family 22 protein [Patellaria atrata CBS 101060]|uniref:Mannosyltransferase n=1 Tax=Patellaria atrata CBS 101060 TaxID=1346257 RepID=A0A9P4S2L7_9PEZI|nr:glycosyltransferase family 22 protein [Patellaria atrata CBS 101060]